MLSPRTTAYAALTSAVLFGTLYSVINKTYLDTSDPLISSLPHPLRHTSYFASKSNIFNTWFVKKAWGWTSLAFAALWLTSPSTTIPDMKLGSKKKRMIQWVLATLVWMTFASWFFGPPVIDRLVSLSGGECVVILPSPDGAQSASTLTVPHEFCYTRTPVSPKSHPELFITPLALPSTANWSARPRYLKGHDVSGHIFLLTMSVLFLADQLAPTLKLNADQRTAKVIRQEHQIALYFAFAISGLWVWMSYMTSVYWHTPGEKLTGFVIGVLGHLVTTLADRL